MCYSKLHMSITQKALNSYYLGSAVLNQMTKGHAELA